MKLFTTLKIENIRISCLDDEGFSFCAWRFHKLELCTGECMGMIQSTELFHASTAQLMAKMKGLGAHVMSLSEREAECTEKIYHILICVNKIKALGTLEQHW